MESVNLCWMGQNYLDLSVISFQDCCWWKITENDSLKAKHFPLLKNVPIPPTHTMDIEKSRLSWHPSPICSRHPTDRKACHDPSSECRPFLSDRLLFVMILRGVVDEGSLSTCCRDTKLVGPSHFSCSSLNSSTRIHLDNILLNSWLKASNNPHWPDVPLPAQQL